MHSLKTAGEPPVLLWGVLGGDMTQIEVYSFESKEGEFGCFTTLSWDEAKDYAEEYELRVIANIYEYSDSELAADFTELT